MHPYNARAAACMAVSHLNSLPICDLRDGSLTSRMHGSPQKRCRAIANLRQPIRRYDQACVSKASHLMKPATAAGASLPTSKAALWSVQDCGRETAREHSGAMVRFSNEYLDLVLRHRLQHVSASAWLRPHAPGHLGADALQGAFILQEVGNAHATHQVIRRAGRAREARLAQLQEQPHVRLSSGALRGRNIQKLDVLGLLLPTLRRLADALACSSCRCRHIHTHVCKLDDILWPCKQYILYERLCRSEVQ